MSMLGGDLTKSAIPHPDVRGVARGATAEALYATLAAHFDIAVDDVRTVLNGFVTSESIATPAGWRLAARFVEALAPSATPFKPVVH